MHTIALKSASGVSATQLHAAFVSAFADYLLGPFELDIAQWPGFLARQGVDLDQSRVAMNNGEILAFTLVAPRPESGRWRLATIGALPKARGSGAAPALLEDAIERATIARAGELELEVFAQNGRAVAMYRRHGFQSRHELFGYHKEIASTASAPETVRDVSRDEALAWLDEAARRIADLPLQVTAPILASLQVPFHAWQSGDAQLVFLKTGERQLTINSLVDCDESQRHAHLLLKALEHRYPGYSAKVPQLQRDDVGGRALLAAGFERQALHQMWMTRPVGAPR
ncbi:GNAT family N-acetyltransferase [Paludibacterium paludis]|uniref:N-acetyltransferase domain-containing protein n=1 Tax=Paludibacterium paludis TaxID=1225769 RepID=A0A918UB55_9NEIS|nr:N-acetyltransferase [Paludibacterium paludis]GGY22327.1 hypothetical protein GCM10011289_27540 [Paludibacterium paludis]